MKDLTVTARKHGLKVHMDGARFSNALVSLGCTPAEMTWKSGIDVLSLGGTKNGCLMAEAVVFFDRSLAEDFRFRRKRSGQTLSKQRLIGAQFEAWLEGDHWRELASHANSMARRMAEGLVAIPGLRLGWPCEINEVFPVMPQALMDHLIAQGARFYDWSDISMEPATRPRMTRSLRGWSPPSSPRPRRWTASSRSRAISWSSGRMQRNNRRNSLFLPDCSASFGPC